MNSRGLSGVSKGTSRPQHTPPEKQSVVELPAMKTQKVQPRTADEALTRLKEGNDRFVSGQAQFPTVQKEVLAELALGQQPYATIIGCSDSRVPPELVF